MELSDWYIDHQGKLRSIKYDLPFMIIGMFKTMGYSVIIPKLEYETKSPL